MGWDINLNGHPYLMGSFGSARLLIPSTLYQYYIIMVPYKTEGRSIIASYTIGTRFPTYPCRDNQWAMDFGLVESDLRTTDRCPSVCLTFGIGYPQRND